MTLVSIPYRKQVSFLPRITTSNVLSGNGKQVSIPYRKQVSFLQAGTQGARLSSDTFQFLTGSRFHFYRRSTAKWQRRHWQFQFLTGSRFHFYCIGSHIVSSITWGFNSLQEVGFISTENIFLSNLRLAIQVSIPYRKQVSFLPVTASSGKPPAVRSFNSLQEVGFISTEAIDWDLYPSPAEFQFLTGSRFHFYPGTAEFLGVPCNVSIPYRKQVSFLRGQRKTAPHRDSVCFNSLQEVGFISTRSRHAHPLVCGQESFNSLQEVGFISTDMRQANPSPELWQFQFLTGSRFHFYIVQPASQPKMGFAVSIPYRKQVSFLQSQS